MPSGFDGLFAVKLPLTELHGKYVLALQVAPVDPIVQHLEKDVIELFYYRVVHGDVVDGRDGGEGQAFSPSEYVFHAMLPYFDVVKESLAAGNGFNGKLENLTVWHVVHSFLGQDLCFMHLLYNLYW